jgi:hypothetical protein
LNILVRAVAEHEKVVSTNSVKIVINTLQAIRSAYYKYLSSQQLYRWRGDLHIRQTQAAMMADPIAERRVRRLRDLDKDALPNKPGMISYEYAREALKNDLAVEAKLGVKIAQANEAVVGAYGPACLHICASSSSLVRSSNRMRPFWRSTTAFFGAVSFHEGSGSAARSDDVRAAKANVRTRSGFLERRLEILFKTQDRVARRRATDAGDTVDRRSESQRLDRGEHEGRLEKHLFSPRHGRIGCD